MDQLRHGICNYPLHNPPNTEINETNSSNVKLLSINYHFWLFLAVFSWKFFAKPVAQRHYEDHGSLALLLWCCLPEGSEGLPELSEGPPELSEGLVEGSEELPEVYEGQI